MDAGGDRIRSRAAWQRLWRIALIGAILALFAFPFLTSGLRLILFAEGGVNWTAALGAGALVALAAVERSVQRRWIWVGLALLLLMSIGIAIVLGATQGPGALARLFTQGAVFVAVVGAAYLEYLFVTAGRRRADPEIDRFGQAVWPGLQKLRPTVVGYGLVYHYAVLWFGYLYDALHWLDPQGAFRNATGADFGTFLYFSLLTVTTLGYTDIMPASFWAQVAVSFEVLFGIAWTLIVFAALLLDVEARAQTSRAKADSAPDLPPSELASLTDEIRLLRAAIEAERVERARSPLRRLSTWLSRPG